MNPVPNSHPSCLSSPSWTSALGLGQKGCSRAMRGCWPHTVAAFLVSLLTPLALFRCDFLCFFCLCHAKMPSQEVSLQEWMFALQLAPPHNLQGTCMPSSGKTACHDQMGEDRREEWWKVTGYGLNARTSIARLNTISLPAVTIE